MGMVVKNNMSALSTLNTLTKNSNALSKSLAKVSSGMKINSAADDASGYAISEKMRVQIRSLDQANQNTQNGSSLLKVAEGAVSSTVDILKTLKEKVVNAANDTNTTADRQTIQKELNNAIDQINDNAAVTFNGKTLVDGSVNGAVKQTYTASTNEGFQTATAGSSALTDLLTRDGNKVDIKSSDTITVSFVKNAHTYTTSYSVSNTTLEDVLKAANKSDADYKTAIDGVGSSITDINTAADKVFTQLSGQLSGTASSVTATTLTYKNSTGATATLGLKGTSDDSTAVTNLFQAMNTAASVTAGGKADIMSTISQLSEADLQKALQGTFEDGTSLSTDQQTAISDLYTKIKGSADYTAIGAALTSATGSAVTVTVGGKDVLIAAAAVSNAYASTNDAAMKDLMSALKGASTEDIANMTVKGDTTANATAIRKALVAFANDYQDAMKKASFNETVGSSSIIGKTSTGVTQYTASGESALTFTAANSGIAGQIAGLTLSVKGTDGNVKKSINTLLDNFSETIRAQDKSADNSINLQIGTKASQSIKAGLTDMRGLALGLQGTDKDGNLTTIDVTTRDHANAAINVMDSAIQKALDQQTTIGAVESRLEYTSSNLTTASENVTSAESTIRDSNIAKEMTEYTKNNVLMQASQSMLAQANQSSSGVLSLLQ